MNKKTKTATLGKIRTGIAGFDQLTGGGLPENRTTLVLGGPGSGKTVFALQALLNNARAGEAGIFVSFDTHPRQVVEDGVTFGWDLAELEKEKLLFLDARMTPGMVKAGHFDLSGMLAGLRAVATELGAKCIVFDSLDVMLTLLDDRLAELQEVFRLRDWLYQNSFTSIITANLDGPEARAAQRQAFMHFIADCTVSLTFQPANRTAARHLRVVKYRGSGFDEREFPFVFGNAGIELQAPPIEQALQPPTVPAALRPEIEQARKELAEQVQALDHFLEMKQAELEFLRHQKAARPEQPRRRAPIRQAKLAPKT